MCLAGEEYPGGSPTGSGAGGGSVPEVFSTAPRIGLDLDAFQQIDWAEVAKAASIGTVAGAISGVKGALSGGLGGAAIAVESQEDVDIEDLFEIKHDMIIIPGYVPFYLH